MVFPQRCFQLHLTSQTQEKIHVVMVEQPATPVIPVPLQTHQLPTLPYPHFAAAAATVAVGSSPLPALHHSDAAIVDVTAGADMELGSADMADAFVYGTLRPEERLSQQLQLQLQQHQLELRLQMQQQMPQQLQALDGSPSPQQTPSAFHAGTNAAMAQLMDGDFMAYHATGLLDDLGFPGPDGINEVFSVSSLF